VYTKLKSDIDPRAGQIKLHLKSLAYKFNDLGVNADRATDPKGIDGIKVRCADLVTDDSELQIDAAGLDISQTGRSEYDTHLFLDYINQLADRMDGSGKKVIVADRYVQLALISMFRRSSLLDITRDQWDRKNIVSLQGMPILRMGYLADQTTRVMPHNFDDSTVSGTSSRTSLFIVEFAEGEGVHGVQLSELDTRDIGELQDKPVMRHRLQWTWGLANWGRRSIARLKGLYVASA
jgi:hypothetical protein